jgi:hypothetical protein
MSGAVRTVRAMHDTRTVRRDGRALRRVDPPLWSRSRRRAAERERQRRREACDADCRDASCARLAALTGSVTCREAEPLAWLRRLEMPFSSIERAAFGPDGSWMYPLSPPANHRSNRIETTRERCPTAQPKRRIRTRDRTLNMRKWAAASREQSHLPPSPCRRPRFMKPRYAELSAFRYHPLGLTSMPSARRSGARMNIRYARSLTATAAMTRRAIRRAPPRVCPMSVPP